MEHKAIHGVRWTVLSYAVSKAVTVGATIVLARLLAPADFGVVALGLLAVESLSYLTGLGLGPALIVRQDLGHKGAATGMTLMALLGAGAGVVLFFAAPLVAAGFDEPRLTAVLRWLAATLPIASLASFYATIIQRELEFRRRFLAQAAQVAAYAGVAITLAWTGAGVWSLVGGHIASSAGYLIAGLALSPHRVRPGFDRAAARGLCATGVGFTLQATAAFAQHNVDYLAIGRLLGSAPLGFYTMAFRLSELPYYAIADPVAQVTFPRFSRMHAAGEDVGRAFLGALQVVAVASVPFGVILAAAAEPFTLAVLGRPWLAMAGALSVLGLWGTVRPAQTMLSWFLNSVGYARRVGALSVAMTVVLLPAVFATAAWSGIVAVSWTVLTGLVVFALALALVVRDALGVGLQAQWGAVRAPAFGGTAAYFAGRVAVEVAGGAPAVLRLAAAVIAVLVTYAVVVTISQPSLLPEALRKLGRMAGQGDRSDEQTGAVPGLLGAATRPPPASPSVDEVP
ncbi:MAG: lipopolysaccharide biosynthesis protein [Acidimicrobiia bacterium]